MIEPENRTPCKNPVIKLLQKGDYISWNIGGDRVAQGYLSHMARGGHLVVRPQLRCYAPDYQKQKRLYQYDHLKVCPSLVIAARRLLGDGKIMDITKGGVYCHEDATFPYLGVFKPLHKRSNPQR